MGVRERWWGGRKERQGADSERTCIEESHVTVFTQRVLDPARRARLGRIDAGAECSSNGRRELVGTLDRQCRASYHDFLGRRASRIFAEYCRTADHCRDLPPCTDCLRISAELIFTGAHAQKGIVQRAAAVPGVHCIERLLCLCALPPAQGALALWCPCGPACE